MGLFTERGWSEADASGWEAWQEVHRLRGRVAELESAVRAYVDAFDTDGGPDEVLARAEAMRKLRESIR